MTKPTHTPAAARSSRRRFTKTVAAALVAAPLTAAMTAAQTPPGVPREATAPPNPQPTPAPPATQPPAPLVEAYAAVARVRFGDKLTPADMERVTRDLRGNVRVAELLRAVKLQNGDEPDFIFSA